MPIRDLFRRDVTRDIPPVVYFHEDSPERLAAEVGEYIITGGWPDGHPRRRHVQGDGIHEQFVRLLEAIADQTAPGRSLSYPPAVWISGFYGSGKSSFAKLLGLALDGRVLPDGRTLAEALLAQDRSPEAGKLRDAWRKLVQHVEPMAAVFDIGGRAREGEQVHLTILREVRQRLGYATKDSVAAHELALQRDGHYEAFLAHAEAELGRPWSEVRTAELVETDFSAVMARQFPSTYTDPLAWFLAFEQKHQSPSASEAARDIRDMLAFTKNEQRTLFIVVDEVSQYLQQDGGRMLALQSFVSELESRLKGRVWLLVTGQEKLEEAVAQRKDFGKMHDRFPPRFRVHLSAANIRDVVHKRLLEKSDERVAELEALYDAHRPDLQQYAFGGEQLTRDAFVELYPLLPGWIDLLMELTTALRRRSSRSQGDDQTIRGLLQLLGEVFRLGLADAEPGALVSIDRVFDIQHTALDSDAQQTLVRMRTQLADDDPYVHRVVKAVALLELISETHAVTPDLVASCLYDRVGAGNRVDATRRVLDDLKSRGLLAYTEKQGFKLQSSAAEEWNSERDRYGVGGEAISDLVAEKLAYLMGQPQTTSLQGRSFPWAALYSDGKAYDEHAVKPSRDPSSLVVDFRYLPDAEAREATWQKRSDEKPLRGRLVWLAGNRKGVDHIAREWARSSYMLRKYRPQKETLPQAKKELLLQEEGRLEQIEPLLIDAVATAFVDGRIYFCGRPLDVGTLGSTFTGVLEAAGQRVVGELFAQFVPTRLLDRELGALLERELTGLSPKLLDGELGLCRLEEGRYEPTCTGRVPQNLLQHVVQEGGATGERLLRHFGAAPYGYDPSVVKAAAAALLRAGRVKAQPESGAELGSIRDAGARDLFDRDRAFRAATWFATEEPIDRTALARLAKFLRTTFDLPASSREPADIADTVEQQFPKLAAQRQRLIERWESLPAPRPALPEDIEALGRAIEGCMRNLRRTQQTVDALARALPALNEGVPKLRALESELTDAALAALKSAAAVRDAQAAQLSGRADIDSETQAAIDRVREQLARPRPWIDLDGIQPDLAALVETYRRVRTHLLAEQGRRAERARADVKGRKDYEKLTPDESNQVLRPIADAVDGSGADAVRPALSDLEQRFSGALEQAVEDAMETLDRILARKKRPPGPGPGPGPVNPPPAPAVVRVETGLKHREIDSEAELDRVLAEVRARVKAKLGPGVRVRLV